MQYCYRTIALFILCIYLFILIDASHLLVTNDNNSKHQKKEIKVANDNSKGIGKKLKQKHNLIRIKPWQILICILYNCNSFIGISADHQEPISRIINQDEKPEDIYPWLAGVLMDYTTLRKKEKKYKGCTGSLISERQNHLFV